MSLTINRMMGVPFGKYRAELSDDNIHFDYYDSDYRPDAKTQRKNAPEGALCEKPRSEDLVSIADMINASKQASATASSKGEGGNTINKKLYSIAKSQGPLFGLRYSQAEEDISEPLAAWAAASEMFSFAARVRAVLDGRTSVSSLEEDCFCILSMPEDGLSIELLKPFATVVPSEYATSMNLDTYGKPAAYSLRKVMGFDMYLACDWTVIAGQDVLRVRAASEGYTGKGDKKDRRIISCSKLAKTIGKFDGDIWNTLLEKAFSITVNSHTNSMRLEWADSTYSISFGCLLERLWHSFAVIGSEKVIGVCEYCGNVFFADKEKKDRKRFCSEPCQNRAKAKRQQQRRKESRQGKVLQDDAGNAVANAEPVGVAD